MHGCMAMPTEASLQQRQDLGRPDVATTLDTFYDDEDRLGPGPSSLSGLTIQQILDIDVENLAVKIDKHHCQTKKAVLVRGWTGKRTAHALLGQAKRSFPHLVTPMQDHFMDTKMRLLTSQSQAVEEERRLGKSRLDAKQAEIEMMKWDDDHHHESHNNEMPMSRYD